jgi:hypothetical protein
MQSKNLRRERIERTSIQEANSTTCNAKHARTPRREIDIGGMMSNQGNSSSRSMRARSLGVADDNSCTFFAQYAPFSCLGTPVPALLATEEPEHARWLVTSL